MVAEDVAAPATVAVTVAASPDAMPQVPPKDARVPLVMRGGAAPLTFVMVTTGSEVSMISTFVGEIEPAEPSSGRVRIAALVAASAMVPPLSDSAEVFR